MTLNNFEHTEFKEIKRRLHAGETIIVLYNNADNDLFPIECEFNLLKLVPIGDGKYNRFWRTDDNTGWEDQSSDYNRGAVIDNMNALVHIRIFEVEQEGIDYIDKIWKEARKRYEK